jgi:hypothetical protein
MAFRWPDGHGSSGSEASGEASLEAVYPTYEEEAGTPPQAAAPALVLRQARPARASLTLPVPSLACCRRCVYFGARAWPVLGAGAAATP